MKYLLIIAFSTIIVNSYCQIDTCGLVNEFAHQLVIYDRMEISKTDSIFIYTSLPHEKCSTHMKNIEFKRVDDFEIKYSESYSILLSISITDQENTTFFYFNGFYSGIIKYDGMLKMEKIDNKWSLTNSYVVKGVH